MFEARNPSYRGPERRGHPRRGASDRRQTIRFEPGNDDRRQIVGRREDDLAAHVWQSELS
ncbi:MAG: hypothetical protein AB8B48_06475 [Pseudomonadales bacterium]